MNSIIGSPVRSGRFSPRTASRSAWWRVAAIAVLLSGFVAAPSAVRAAPSDGAHVFLMRGVLNIFSLGMDEIAGKLQRQGINATVHNHILWASVAADAAAEYKSGRVKTIILVGHSSGATCLPDIVARLNSLGVPVKLAIGLDSVFHTSLQGRVGRYINFYVANGAGTRVDRAKDFRGKLENVDVDRMPGVTHLTIDKNEAMQRKIIAEINAAVRSGPATVAADKPQQQVVRAAPEAASPKRPATAN